METKIVDAFIPAHTCKAVETIIRSLSTTAHIGINLTGGTKVMFAGELSICNKFPIGGLFQNKDFRAYKIPYGRPEPPLEFSEKHYNVAYERNKAVLILEGNSLPVTACKDFATYIRGGWLEEYTYLQFLPLIESKRIFDLRICVSIVPMGQIRRREQMTREGKLIADSRTVSAYLS